MVCKVSVIAVLRSLDFGRGFTEPHQPPVSSTINGQPRSMPLQPQVLQAIVQDT